MKSKRLEKIEEIIKELKELKTESNGYAVVENIKFFEAIKSPLNYIGWLVFVASKIDKEKIIELNDFPKEEWEENLHRNLIKMERKRIPGMIEPLKRRIIEVIHTKEPRLIINLGAGAMELERQVVESLLRTEYDKKITFVAVDRSAVAKRIGMENLADLQDRIEIEQIDQLDKDRLATNYKKNIRIFLCSNDIFELDKEFGNKFFDLVLFAKFKHHLREAQKVRLDTIIKTTSKQLLEFDDYRSWGLLIPQSIATWKYPVLMNGAIFSRLRDYTRKELREERKTDERLEFFKNGSYLIEHSDKDI